MSLLNKRIFFSALFLSILTFVEASAKNYSTPVSSNNLYFVENKGQLADEFGNKRTDIQFYATTNSFSFFAGKGKVHYQLKKAEYSCELPEVKSPGQTPLPIDEINRAVVASAPVCTEYNRVDVELLNSRPNAEIIFSDKQEYYENYYTANCPLDGIHANTYKRITYKNVYPDIDWVFYVKGNKLEYEFVIGPNGDKSQIKLQYSGAESTYINENRDLKIRTPLGDITEHAPLCYKTNTLNQNHSENTNYLPSHYTLTHNVLTYEVAGENSLVIDPSIEWGTYYGLDSSVTMFYGLSCDNAANIYAAGKTYSTALIATSGSFQGSIGGDMDACLVKFDSSGNRLWATYYGSAGTDWATGVSYDNAGHVFMGGCTSSNSGMVTPGCQQPVYGGGSFNGFLARFTTSGIRQWCTYLGGNSATEPVSVCTDHIGHVYISGLTNDNTNISTPGSCQPAPGGGHDLFVIQYDTLGVRQWGTYYGGSGDEFRGEICTDASNNLYFCGWTYSSTHIATAGTYQSAIGGNSDAFLVKFNSAGVRQWGTYYGGPLGETTGALSVDSYGLVYLFGTTSSDAGIASPGCYQPTRGGGQDAFIAKFDPTSGHRFWGTYYGGPGDEVTTYSKICSDYDDNVFITGTTTSATGLASYGAWQSAYAGGNYDGFVAKFNGHGIEFWSTYLGGEADDNPTAIVYDGLNAYICGTSNSTTNIATPGSFLPTGGGLTFYNQGFLIKISDFLPSSTPDVTVDAQNIALYPSPNTGTFTVSGNLEKMQSGSVKILVSDVSGKVVYTSDPLLENSQINAQINLADGLPNGIYFLRLVSENMVKVLPFQLSK